MIFHEVTWCYHQWKACQVHVRERHFQIQIIFHSLNFPISSHSSRKLVLYFTASGEVCARTENRGILFQYCFPEAKGFRIKYITEMKQRFSGTCRERDSSQSLPHLQRCSQLEKERGLWIPPQQGSRLCLLAASPGRQKDTPEEWHHNSSRKTETQKFQAAKNTHVLQGANQCQTKKNYLDTTTHMSQRYSFIYG